MIFQQRTRTIHLKQKNKHTIAPSWSRISQLNKWFFAPFFRSDQRPKITTFLHSKIYTLPQSNLVTTNFRWSHREEGYNRSWIFIGTCASYFQTSRLGQQKKGIVQGIQRYHAHPRIHAYKTRHNWWRVFEFTFQRWEFECVQGT